MNKFAADLGARLLLKHVRAIMASSVSSRERFNSLVTVIAMTYVNDECSIFEVLPDNSVLLRATEGRHPDAIDNVRYHPGEGLLGHIVRTGETLYLPQDATSHPSYATRDDLLRQDFESVFHSFLGVPIVRAGKVRGILALQNRTWRGYEEFEIEILATVAALASEIFNSTEETTDVRTNIFISYRRADSHAFAHQLYDNLCNEFSRGRIFIDVDSIPIAVDFAAHIENYFRKTSVILAVMGNRWESPSWKRRPFFRRPAEDYVLRELQLAREQEIPVIPILLDSRRMPEGRRLPKPIQYLAKLNAAQFGKNRNFEADFKFLSDRIKEISTWY